MSNLDKLRSAGLAHPTHEFTESERDLIDSLTDDEVRAVISAKHKLGDDLIRKKAEGDDTHPDTLTF